MVGRATVDRWISRSRGTGPLAASPMGGARHERKVTEEGEKFVRELLDAMPDSTQRELADAYEQQFGVKLHRSTMGRSVERMGFTRKWGR
jgi:transposase